MVVTPPLGLTVRTSQIATAKLGLERERMRVARGTYGFRTQADRCTEQQADAAEAHAERALRLHGIR